MDNFSFHGGALIYVDWFGVTRVDGGYLMDGDQGMIYGPIVDGSQVHENIENIGNGNSDVFSKLCPYYLDTSLYSTAVNIYRNPSVVGYTQGVCGIILYYLKKTPTVTTVGTVRSSGDNPTFCVRKI